MKCCIHASLLYLVVAGEDPLLWDNAPVLSFQKEANKKMKVFLDLVYPTLTIQLIK